MKSVTKGERLRMRMGAGNLIYWAVVEKMEK